MDGSINTQIIRNCLVALSYIINYCKFRILNNKIPQNVSRKRLEMVELN